MLSSVLIRSRARVADRVPPEDDDDDASTHQPTNQPINQAVSQGSHPPVHLPPSGHPSPAQRIQPSLGATESVPLSGARAGGGIRAAVSAVGRRAVGTRGAARARAHHHSLPVAAEAPAPAACR
eukprot:scaffold7246_cov410-Prasinococcus_capsulatus_cf.AAC.14